MYANLVLSVLLALATPFVRAALFINKKTYMGPDFFQDFTWQTADDPTHGRVNFVDLQTALVKNLTAGTYFPAPSITLELIHCQHLLISLSCALTRQPLCQTTRGVGIALG